MNKFIIVHCWQKSHCSYKTMKHLLFYLVNPSLIDKSCHKILFFQSLIALYTLIITHAKYFLGTNCVRRNQLNHSTGQESK